MTLLHANPSTSYTTSLRALIFLMWLLKFCLDPIQQMATLPQELIVPTAPVSWLPRGVQLLLLTEPALITLRLVGAVSAILTLVPGQIRWASLVCCTSATIYQSLIKGLGHVNHAEICLLLSTLVYTFSVWTPRPKVHPEPLILTLILLTTYVLTATYRLGHGNWRVFVSDSIIFWLADNCYQRNYYNFNWGEWVVDHQWKWIPMKIGFFLVTLLELTSPLVIILSVRYRVIYLFSMLGFHLAVLMTMNLLFWENMLLLGALLGLPEKWTEQPSVDSGASG